MEAKFRVSLEGKDELSQFFERSGRGAKTFSSMMHSELSKVGADLGSMVRSTTSAIAGLGGLAASFGFAQQARGVVELRDAIQGVAVTAGLADDQIAGLRAQILSASQATNQFGQELTDALGAFVAKTGDVETGRKNLELYGKTATATRASIADIANIGADLKKLNIGGDQTRSFAILAKQADVGAVELKDLASQGPRLLSAFGAAGLKGEKGLREGGAFAQVAQLGTGNVERTSTAVEAAFRDVMHANKMGKLRGSGIDVLDPKTHEMRDQVEVILDIIRKTKGRQDLLTSIFQEESIRAINPLAKEFRETGGFATYEKFRDVSGDESIIDSKFKQNTNTAAARFKQAQIKMQGNADKNLGDKIDQLSTHADLVAELHQGVLEHPLLAAGGLVGGKLALGVGGRAIKGAAGGLLDRLFPGAGAAASAVAGGDQGDGSRVFVTNWPSSLGGGSGTLPGAAGLGLPGVGGAGGLAASLPLIASLGVVVGGMAAQVETLVELGKASAMKQGFAVTEIKPEAAAELAAAAAAAEERGRQERGREGGLLLYREEQRKKDEAAAKAAKEGAAIAGIGEGTVGAYGGMVTPAQMRAAYKGQGSYGLSAELVKQRFGEQQATLRAMAGGLESGLDTGFVGEQTEGGANILAAIARSNPEFAGASGKRKAAILRAMAGRNDLAGGVNGGHIAAGYNPFALFNRDGMTMPSHDMTDLGTPETAATAAPPDVNLNLVVNINGDDVTTEGDGTRGARVAVKRGAGASS